MGSGRGSLFTSDWQEAPVLDQVALQVVPFLFSNRRSIARLKSNTQFPSVTLWRSGRECFFVYLTDKSMGAADLSLFLEALEQVAEEEIFPADQNQRLQFSVCLFAKKFDSNFAPKLRFFSMPIQLYEWSRSENDQKATILVHEIPTVHSFISSAKGIPESLPDSSTFPEKISSDELSAFVQLGIDLRKMRELSPLD